MQQIAFKPAATPASHPRSSAIALLGFGKPGPDPLEARLVLRGREKGRVKRWYIADGPTFLSTKAHEHEREKAEKRLAEYKRRRLLLDAGKFAPGDLLFRDVIKEWCDAKLRLACTDKEKRLAHKLVAPCVRLIQFFGSIKLIGYRKQHSREFMTWYVGLRRPYYDARPDSLGDPRTNGRHLLRLLRRICREFDENAESGWHPVIHVPKAGRSTTERAVPRAAIARMLWACRGRRWDAARGGWETRTTVRKDGSAATTRIVEDARTIEGRRGASRAIRIAYRIGLRKEIALSMTWGRYARLPSFDVNDDGEGIVNRRGYLVPASNKGAEPSAVPAMMAWLLAIWKRQDGQSADSPRTAHKWKYVVRNEHGGYFRSYDFRPIIRDAGLDRSVLFHGLKHSAMKFAHEAGYTITAAAEMLATEPETLLKHYTNWGAALATESAKTVYDDRAGRVRFRKGAVGTAGEVKGREADDRIRAQDLPFKPRSKKA